MTSDAVHLPAVPPSGTAEEGGERPAVVVARTGRGWGVFSPGRAEDVGDLLEGMALADLVAEDLGVPAEPDRTARRAARGTGEEEPSGDPRAARIAALERTVAQLEHALASRVVVERAIGVLAERHAVAPRAAFEGLRAQARSFGRPVHELAREVLGTLERLPGEPRPDRPLSSAAAPLPEGTTTLAPPPRRGPGRRVERSASRPGPAAPADGRR
ncbi:ANTAR domain-containing protein [Geodermatophilus dictyosporus]|uniref:ANTAR domain-containing protein n=1 Tax=Geodermatophilus dictyosporus TaxID=1523247 RepID=A0A1I5L4J8_9ACTN|nr:ANTAR domain-containing protein [Geodermatophilus dictyosporus]SFO92250.1 ANTAR domain-containing protein [Geodermatophilus dictyosporus]